MNANESLPKGISLSCSVCGDVIETIDSSVLNFQCIDAKSFDWIVTPQPGTILICSEICEKFWKKFKGNTPPPDNEKIFREEKTPKIEFEEVSQERKNPEVLPPYKLTGKHFRRLL